MISINHFVLVTFTEDLIALEQNETFYLKLKPRSAFSGLMVLFCDSLEITIIDSDCK